MSDGNYRYCEKCGGMLSLHASGECRFNVSSEWTEDVKQLQKEKLEAKNAKLKDREQKLLEVIKTQSESLEFYADADNWEKTSPLHYLKINKSDLVFRDISILAHIGGKRARQAIAKVEAMLKELNK